MVKSVKKSGAKVAPKSKVDADALMKALNAKKGVVSDFAIIDIKSGRGAVADHFDKLPDRVGPIPDEFKLPFVLQGHLNSINSANDGESQEFSAHVDYIEFNANLRDLTENRKFRLGDKVRKKSGSVWQGEIVGFYSTKLNSVGYCIESDAHPGSVQIYPESALEAF